MPEYLGKSQAMGIPSPQGSLPNSTHLGKVRIAVSNLDESVHFYRNIIGLHLLNSHTSPRDGNPLIARLGAVEGSVLLELEQLPGIRPLHFGARLGLYHTAFLLPTRSDLGSFVRHLQQLNVSFGSSDHLINEALYLVDPDGLTVEVYADRPRSEWTYDEHRMLIGTLAPLNLAEVTSLTESAWAEVPAGTTLGHLHFYVDNLQQSKNYYHDAMGFDIVTRLPGALFVSAGGYHHHVGLNTWISGSPRADSQDARILFWELMVPDQTALSKISSRLRGRAASVDESDSNAPVFIDADGICVVVRAEKEA